MLIHSGCGNAQLGGDLLVGESSPGTSQDIDFPWSQGHATRKEDASSREFS